jgi:cellulose synthase/poly-beta-1,6-N-acetylglucosamine synthase-like glycosyltransferase
MGMSVLIFFLVSLQSALTLTSAYLLGLLVAARSVSPESKHEPEGSTPTGGGRLAVIIPAYNEEDGIASTIESLRACEGSEQARVIVLADNCTDGTAARAAATGIEVWEREEPDRRGKGYALATAFARLFAREEELAGVAVVDADCTVSPNFLTAVSTRLAGGTQALQVDYLAANPTDSPISALRFAAFAVGDTVRFRGKEGIGHSCGLVGTGMAFSPALLKEVPWTVTGLVEDGEYHMRLVQAGARAEFVPEAWVSQAVPTSLKASSDQQARWEMGKAQLVRRWAPQLVASGLRHTDSIRLHAGLECLVPPQTVLALGNGFGLAAGLALRSRRLFGLSLLGTLAQATFVIGGLRMVRAPACVYRALLSAPALIANKLGLYARIALGKGPSGWVRTERGG